MEIDGYFRLLSDNFQREYKVAADARKKGFDPKDVVEIMPAPDLASRVEGLIGLEGIGRLIRKNIGGQGRSRLAFDVAREICTDAGFEKYNTTERILLAVRVGTAILTEGVLVAPTEGIQGIVGYRNPDGTSYISALYAGPIRGAGGTAAALSVALADFARKIFNIGEYKPTREEIERYVEEVELYHTRAARLQYRPSDDDVRMIISNCPVCIDGVPTENIEVSAHGNIRRLDAEGRDSLLTNRVRGGVPLVLCEGIAQKAKKMLKETKGVGLDWGWLNNIIKVELKKSSSERDKEDAVFLEELVAGRPILAYPGRMGGFRLRYGRSRFTGIAAKGFNPATMIIVDGFIAVGTQVKVELPGKGCVAMPVDSIEGPFVVLRNGNALRINEAETALRLRDDVAEILSLGDILITYGDFKKSNTQLRPSSYVEEIWNSEFESASGRKPEAITEFRQAYLASSEYGIPMHPMFLFEFQGVDMQMLSGLALRVLASLGDVRSLFSIDSVVLPNDGTKRTLELLLVPHSVSESGISISREYAQSLIASLGFAKGADGALDDAQKVMERYPSAGNVIEFLNSMAPFRIMRRSTTIGARIGRPEKSRERLMKPAPHALFPISDYGGKERNIAKAAMLDSRKFRSEVKVEISRYRCVRCMRIVDTAYCYDCESKAVVERRCARCGAVVAGAKCQVCGAESIAYEERGINLPKIVANSMGRIGVSKMPKIVKGVRGLTNRNKVPEALEKGILRALNDIYIFKDGTVRFDATDVPITHFYPDEFGVGIERLRELGYTKDYTGNELLSSTQLVELKHQDVILNRRSMEYFLRVSHFVDQLLESLYGLGRFYNAMSISDIIGRMVITLSPHTSCGVLNRIIGFTDASVGFAHPYTIAARRRNCDGDEDTSMLLLDALLNFSREFMPGSIGGSMDTPLILTLNVMPEEVDDEVHAMEVVERYPLDFYEKACNYAYPSEVALELVEGRLGKDSIFSGLMFTHHSSANAIRSSPRRSRYTELKSMQEKVDAEFRLMDKIYAINKSDAARKLILSHFIPDIIGNLHSFSRQAFRCTSCNAKYRRVPLSGKCAKDGGKLLLTISKGSIEKYLDMAIGLAERYGLDPYIRQRLLLIKEEIAGFFEEAVKEGAANGQFSLARYM